VTFESPWVTEIPSIVLEGEIDPGAVIALQRRIVEALNAGQRRVVVDLSAVTVLGGAPIDLLCGALRWLTCRGATLAIVGGAATRASRARTVRDRWGRAVPERERRPVGRLGDATRCYRY
jgi:ABC-type transporter Mla MlaB component